MYDPGEMEGATILVTGGAGCIGRNLSAKLCDLGAEVTILDDLSSACRWNIPRRPNLRFVEGSVVDDEALAYVFAARPTYVYHLAALFANQNSVEHPETDLSVNGLGTLKVFKYCQVSGVKRVVYASSGCSVYGSKAPLPLTEDFLSIDLDTPYQITKLLGEAYANFFKNYYDLAVVRARFFNVYGPGEVPGAYRNVIPNFIYWAKTNQPLPITGSGEETRDFTYVGDIVEGLLGAALCPEAVGEAFNLASGKETKIIDLAHKILDLTGSQSSIELTQRRKWDTHSRRCASVDRARALIGYSPSTDLDAGLKAAVSWFDENWELILRDARF